MWEYLHKYIDNYACYESGMKSNGEPHYKHINTLGIDRWELVAVKPISNSRSLAIFKRPLLINDDHEMGPKPTNIYEDLR